MSDITKLRRYGIKTYAITPKAAPTPAFSSVATDLSVAFTNSSSGATTSYLWNFGDEETSTEYSPTHAYAAGGTYTVTLTAYGDGGVVPVTHQVTVTAPPLEADFTLDKTSGDAPLEITLTNTSTGAVSIDIDWGDESEHGTAGGSHTYTDWGVYTVTLTATDSEGNTDTKTAEVTATDPALVIINSQWLIDNGPEPYVLDTTNGHYALGVNVTTDGTAFVVKAGGITLDRNGKTITFNDADYIAVANEDFANATGGVPDDWDMSGAGIYTWRSITGSWLQHTTGLFGTNCVRLSLPANSSGSATAALSVDGAPCVITTDAAHGLSTGDYVIMAGFAGTMDGTNLGTNCLRGGFKITRVDDTSFTVNHNVTVLTDNAGSWMKAQAIVSSAVTIPVANRLYSASFQSGNDFNAYPTVRTVVGLVDATTGQEISPLVAGAIQDYFCDFMYEPNSGNTFNKAPTWVGKLTSTNSVKVAIYLANEASSSQNVDVARVRVSRCADCGILCGGGYGPQFLPYYNVEDDYVTFTAGFNLISSVAGGGIVQGKNKGAKCYGIIVSHSTATAGIDTGNVEMTGDDCEAIGMGSYNSSYVWNTVIQDCEITWADKTNASNRVYSPPAMGITAYGTVEVTGCTLTNIPFTGIDAYSMGTPVAGEKLSRVHHNTLYPNSVAVNGMAVTCRSNTRVDNNVIDASEGSSRGMYIGGGPPPDAGMGNIEVDNNVVTIRELKDKETQFNSGYARCLRIRNQEGGPLGYVGDFNIHDNEFTVLRDGADQMEELQAIRISIFLQEGSDMGTCDYQINNNVLSMLDYVGGMTHPSAALSCAWGEGLAPLILSGNTYRSNYCCIQFGTGDDGCNANEVYILNPTFERVSGGGLAVYENFKPIGIGYGSSPTVNNLWIISPTYVNCTEGVKWAGTGAISIHFGWTVNLTVTSGGTAVEGATVTVKDKDSNTLWTGSTDENGLCAALCPVKTINWSGSVESTTTLTPLTISAAKTGYVTQSGTKSPAADDTLALALNAV